ncbi:MAG: hypothetical protein EPN91_02090 [Salinibacterium sp.]|nr:MAG: hypothetical protein EPN91_02090 [Salinibacterium sp.]
MNVGTTYCPVGKKITYTITGSAAADGEITWTTGNATIVALEDTVPADPRSKVAKQLSAGGPCDVTASFDAQPGAGVDQITLTVTQIGYNADATLTPSSPHS